MPSWPVPDPDKAELGFHMLQQGLKPALKLEHLKQGAAQAVINRARQMGLAVLTMMEPGGLESLFISSTTPPVKELLELTRRVDAGYAPPELKDRVGELLGYPACCTRAFHTYHVLDESRQYVLRPYWKTLTRVYGSLNLLPKESLLFHQPCSYDCQASLDLAMKTLSLFEDAPGRLGTLNQPVFFHHHHRYATLGPELDLTGAEFHGHWQDEAAWRGIGRLVRATGGYRNLPWDGRPPVLLPFGHESPVRRTVKAAFLIPPEGDLPVWQPGALIPLAAADAMVMGFDVVVSRPGAGADSKALAEDLRAQGVTLVILPSLEPQSWREALEHQGLTRLCLFEDEGMDTLSLAAPPPLLRPALLRALSAWAMDEVKPGKLHADQLGLDDSFHFHPGDAIRHDRYQTPGRPETRAAAFLGVTPPKLESQAEWVIERKEIPPRLAVAGNHLKVTPKLAEVLCRLPPTSPERRALLLSANGGEILRARERLEEALCLAAKAEFPLVIEALRLGSFHQAELKALRLRQTPEQINDCLEWCEEMEGRFGAFFQWRHALAGAFTLFTPVTTLETLAVNLAGLTRWRLWDHMTGITQSAHSPPRDLRAALAFAIARNYQGAPAPQTRYLLTAAVKYAASLPAGKLQDQEEAVRRFRPSV